MLNSSVSERLSILPTTYKDFLLSDFTFEAAEVFGASLSLDSEKVSSLEDGILLYLLFFLNKESLITYLVDELHIKEKDSQEVVTAIIASLPDYIGEVRIEDTSSSSKLLSDEITETEKKLAAVTTNHEVSGLGIRTMAEDMRTAQSTAPTISPAPSAPTYQPIYPTPPETIYTSNQSDIFPPPPPAPSHDQNLPPRWDSE